MVLLLHCAFLVLAFVQARLLKRQAARLSASDGNEQPGRIALYASAGFIVIVGCIAVGLAAHYQQHWYKIKSFEEIGNAIEQAKARGVTLTEEQAREVALRRLLAQHGRASGLEYGAVAASFLLVLLVWTLAGSPKASPERVPRIMGYAGLGVVILGLIVALLLQQPWGTTRKSWETDSIIHAQWVNDPLPSPGALAAALERREFKEKSGSWVFLGAAGAVALASFLGAWLAIRPGRLASSPFNRARDVKRLGRIATVLSVICTLTLLFRSPGLSGVQRSSTHENARGALGSIAWAEREFHDKDVDGNGLMDWWVGDVSGLHRLHRDGRPIALVQDYLVEADAAPLQPSGDKIKLEPLVAQERTYSYRYSVIPKRLDGTPYAQDPAGEGLALRSQLGFAFCAFPSHYRVTATETLIIDETSIVWRKDIGGSRIEQWPSDPEKEGWTKWIDGVPRPQAFVLGDDDD